MSQVIGVGFCGAGGIVQGNHLPALERRTDRYRVVGFYDVAPDRARKLAADKYRVFETYEDMLADAAVDVVVVATKPLTTHLPATQPALNAGKHVVLEKPMAATSEECDVLIALAREKGVRLTVHHNRRLDLDFLNLQELIGKGKIGEPRFVESRVGGAGYGGGDIVDWGVHLVDQALLLGHGELREVSAMFCHPEGGRDDAGFSEATFRFSEPPLVRMAMMPHPAECLANGTPAQTRFYAAGTKGSFVQRIIEDPRDLMNATVNFEKQRPDYAVPSFLTIERREYYDYLYESLANGAPLLVDPVQARNAIRAMELMEQSARENRTVTATGMA